MVKRRHFLILLFVYLIYAPSRADEGLGEDRLSAASGTEAVGVARRVVGDLVYVEGLNGFAPLWSCLAVAESGEGKGARLEVIQELDDILVARVLSEDGAPVRVADRVIPVGREGPREVRSRRVVYAVRVERGPVLDGRMDDPAWEEARPIEGFVQRDPDYWMPCTERTVARIVYDAERIYFGFECFASQPGRIVANNMRRDSEIWGEDNVQILLDTYNDRQTGFFFFVNPLGAQRDLMLSDEGRTYNEDWDCTWVARTNRHAEGWTAEVAIPFDQLRFKEGQRMVWGINLARYIPCKNEEAQFVVGRRASTSRARYWTSDIGELRGLEGVRTRRLLQVKPYVLPGTSRNREAPDPTETPTFETGADLRYGITPNMMLDLSYNTDFAQVEGDQEQVNLTQFKLFFPEKREFFLEGANLFDFGEAAERRGGNDKPPTLLFYSRRIGLEEKRRVPIMLGTKLAGKTGRTSVGLLNVLTGEDRFGEAGDIVPVSRRNFSVARVKQDLFARSNVGFILVNKQADDPVSGWDTYNRAGGIDFSFSPTVAVNLQGFVARVWDSGAESAGDARFIRIGGSGSHVSARASFLDVEDHFDPEVGFVNRRKGMDGFRQYTARVRLRPRPRAMGIRYISIGPEIKVVTDRQDRVKSVEAEISFWTQFNSADWYRVEVTGQHEVVDEPFAPSSRRGDVVIPADSYTFTTFRTGPSTSRGRKLRVRLSLEAGGYYTGSRYEVSLESYFRPTGRLSVETEYETNWIRLPEGKLNVQTLSNRLIYSFTTDFYVKLFAQWNNDRELMNANFLMNYRFRPGSDLFLVYDQAFGTVRGLTERNRSVLLKLSYLIGL